MPEFQVLRCSRDSCRIFQVQQKKKVNKWACKVCGEKQSTIQVYLESAAASECRKIVQKMNEIQGELDKQPVLPKQNVEPRINCNSSGNKPKESAWAKYSALKKQDSDIDSDQEFPNHTEFVSTRNGSFRENARKRGYQLTKKRQFNKNSDTGDAGAYMQGDNIKKYRSNAATQAHALNIPFIPSKSKGKKSDQVSLAHNKLGISSTHNEFAPNNQEDYTNSDATNHSDHSLNANLTNHCFANSACSEGKFGKPSLVEDKKSTPQNSDVNSDITSSQAHRESKQVSKNQKEQKNYNQNSNPSSFKNAKSSIWSKYASRPSSDSESD